MQKMRDVASNQMTTQQVEVKDNRLLMNDPYTASLSLDAMTPNPEKTPSARGSAAFTGQEVLKVNQGVLPHECLRKEPRWWRQ